MVPSPVGARPLTSATVAPRRVVLLPGLWMPRAVMGWHAARLTKAGFAPVLFGYAAVTRGPDAAVEALAATLAQEPCHVLAHSLGGLVALRALRAHPDLAVARVVCLGSPLCGSAAAGGVARLSLTASTLGQTSELLRHGCAPWTGAAQVGMIAGRAPYGLGRLFGHFHDANDGTVAVAETRLPGLADHVVLNTTHSGLLVSTQVSRQAIAFLRGGRFEHAPADPPTA